MNLQVKIKDAIFDNPVCVASGTWSYEEKYSDAKKIRKLGAIIPKTFTLNRQQGNPPPRVAETASGMINSIGIENEGADYFISDKLPQLKKLRVPIILSISGKTTDEFILLAEKLNSDGEIKGIEINLSCPNLGHKVLVAQDARLTEETVTAVRKVSRHILIAKLSPNVTDITEIAKSAETAGADAVSLVNTFNALAIDIKTRKSKIGNITGGLSGPAIKPAALYMVYKTRQAIRLPIIAMGGIADSADALEFIIAGANMVAVGTASFLNPEAPLEVLSGIEKYMKENKINNISALTGSLKTQ
ncbi:MAG: dihydroorotate dehydrogenase [Candidatus Omnitrophica bacterium]|nr:dihydroorotate dehydrogenase [Candidatus Omnitrophota bacterium]